MTNNDTLIERTLTYLQEIHTKKTTLCRRLNISTTYLYKLLNGERLFSDHMTQIFNDYLIKCGY